MVNQQQTNGLDAPKGMVAPTLFIGVGGTGAEIVGRVKNRVDLLTADVERPDLRFVSYMALDTRPMNRQEATVKACFREDRLGESLASYRYLGGFNGFEYIRGQFQNRATRNPDLRSWWDERIPIEDALIDNGAGRIRAVGRLCLFRHHADVVRMISMKLSSLYSLKEQQQQGIAANLTEMAPNIVLVCGSAGGTGSGMLLDISYMTYHLAREIFHVPPRITAVILLPGLYAKRGAGTNNELAEAFQANSAALFQEIEYFLQNPAQMDQRRLDKVIPAFEPTLDAWVPFHYGYLVSEALAGGSLFEDLSDLYAYVARALFQLHLTPEDVYGGAAGVNLHKISHKPIPGIGRAPAYSSFGFASIEHPTNILQGYLEARYALTLLRYGLGTPETGREDAIRIKANSDARIWLAKTAKEIYSPFIDRLSALRDASISKIPTSIFTSDGRLPTLDKLPAQLQSTRSSAEQVVTTVFNSLNEAYESAAAGILDKMRKRVDQLIDSTPNGFYSVSLLLTAVDNELTQTVSQYSQQRDNMRAKSQEAYLTLNAGPEKMGSQAAVISKPNATTAKEYIRTLQNYTSNKIAEEACRLMIQLLDQICGPPTSISSASLDMLAVESTGSDAIFDEARLHISNILSMLNNMSMQYQTQMDLKRFSTELGNPRVTTFLPELSVDDPASWQELNQQCATLFGDPKRIDQELIELAKTWLQTPGVTRPHMRESIDAVRETISQSLRMRSLELFSGCLSVSIESLLAGCSDRSQRLQQLKHHASLCCTLKNENLPPEFQQPGILWSLGSPSDLRNEIGIDTKGSGHAYMGPRQISLLHTEHGFPSIAVSQLLTPFAIYNRALKPNRGASSDAPPRFFMHNWADWNRAEGLPIGGGSPNVLKSVDPEAIKLFAIGRAINNSASTIATQLKEVVYIDPVRNAIGDIPNPDELGGFIFDKLVVNAEGEKVYQYFFRRYRTIQMKKSKQYQACEEKSLGTDLLEAMIRFSEILDPADRQVLSMMHSTLKQTLGKNFSALCKTYQEKLLGLMDKYEGDEREAIVELYRSLALESIESETQKERA